jgi:hypothetical protein
MTNCACCGSRLERTQAWKGREQRFYCNEFCADHDDAPRGTVPESKMNAPLRLRAAA